jgi:hypothetical protein
MLLIPKSSFRRCRCERDPNKRDANWVGYYVLVVVRVVYVRTYSRTYVCMYVCSVV